jgi:hypothetical protein
MIERVRNPFRREIARLPSITVDTDAGYAHYAYEKQLDRLSLISKAITQLSKLDRVAAIQALREIDGRLDLKPNRCDDALVYNVDSIYRAVIDVAKSGFTSKEVNDGNRAIFLMPWVSDLRSPAQLGPMLDILSEFRGFDSERELLSSSFEKVSVMNFADDRTFTHTLVTRRFGAKLPPLTGGIDDGTKSRLVKAFRDLLIKNLSATRCFENAIDGKSALPQFIVEFNRLNPDSPIVLSEIVQSDVGSAARVERAFKRGESANLRADLGTLIRSKPVAGDAKDAAVEWETRVQLFFQRLSSFEPAAGDDGLLHFHEKAILFETLIKLVADKNELQSSTSAAFLRFLDRSKVRQSNFAHWFTYVDRLPALLSTDFERITSMVPNDHFRLLALRKKLKI